MEQFTVVTMNRLYGRDEQHFTFLHQAEKDFANQRDSDKFDSVLLVMGHVELDKWLISY